jgi:hypothetical protein
MNQRQKDNHELFYAPLVCLLKFGIGVALELDTVTMKLPPPAARRRCHTRTASNINP